MQNGNVGCSDALARPLKILSAPCTLEEGTLTELDNVIFQPGRALEVSEARARDYQAGEERS